MPRVPELIRLLRGVSSARWRNPVLRYKATNAERKHASPELRV